MRLMSWVNSLALVSFMAALPASGSYELNSYGFGGGGTAGSSSTNYSINGSAGEVAGSANSTSYKVGAGENFEKQANVPLASISNPSSWYNKLRLTIDPQSNPTDAKFAVAISRDNFTTTQYVKSDFTVGTTLLMSDYLTYAGWGSGTGVVVRGLVPNSVYTVKAKAYRGAFTESGYGPQSSATLTDIPQLTFDVDVSATDTSTSPPYQVTFGSLPVSTITDSPVRVWISLATNAENGGKVYVSGLNSGLRSASANYMISSLTGDLGSIAEGFGAQGVTATETSGGPFTLVSPYDSVGTNVGIIDGTIREIFSTPAELTGGRGSFILKAKTMAQTPSSSDYTEVLTAIASANF